MVKTNHSSYRFFSWGLTRYIAYEVFYSFFLGTTIFLFIMLMFQAIRLSEFVVLHQVPLKEVGKLSAYLMLSFLPIAIPIAFLFSVLMGISRSNSEGEIIAFQVNGYSILQIFFPLLAFSFLLSISCLYVSLYSVPKGNRAFELLITKLSNERVISQLKPGVFMEGFFGLVLFSEKIFPLRNEMRHIFIYDERDEKHPLAITADAGILKTDLEKGLVTLRLSNGNIHVDKKEATGIQQRIAFEVYDINLENSAPGDSWRDYSPPSYSYPQLIKRIDETTPDPPLQRKLLVELHRRFSFSFSCIILGALGFFISILSHRGIRSTAIVLCLFVGTIYWLSYIAANAVALSGWILPWIGIWLPNLVFLILAFLCYFRYRRV